MFLFAAGTILIREAAVMTYPHHIMMKVCYLQTETNFFGKYFAGLVPSNQIILLVCFIYSIQTKKQNVPTLCRLQNSRIYAGIYYDCQAPATVVVLYRQILIQETLARSHNEENTQTHQWINTLWVLLGTLAALCFNPLFSGRKFTEFYCGSVQKQKKDFGNRRKMKHFFPLVLNFLSFLML